MSQVAPGAPRQGALRSALRLAFCAWHVGCIALGTGCFYIAPVQRPSVNHAPEIITSTEGPILLNRPVTLQVVAFDSDGDELWFFWEPGDYPARNSPQPGRDEDEEVWLSLWDVPLEEFPNGGEVRCTVSDLDEEVTLRWRLEVEE